MFSIKVSPIKGKKYRVVYNGKTIDFGDSNYEDYTIHKDPVRRKRYLRRHYNNESWYNPYTAGFWSRWLLWEYPDINDALKNILNYLI